MSKVKDIIKEIKEGRTQISASVQDEERVMRAMLNDPTYSVGVYDKDGEVGTYCPHDDARDMVSSIISGAAKIEKEEATQLANDYKFKKSDSETIIRLGKEFTNTYLETGRKLPFGKRAKQDVALSIREIEDGTERTYPKKTGVDDNGKDIYVNTTTTIPGHNTWKIHAGCPDHLKK